MSTTMLYKFPGSTPMHGAKFDYIVVADEDIEASLADGWALTTPDAKALHQASVDAAAAVTKAEEESKALAAAVALVEDNQPATKAEIQQRLTDLGIPFDGRAGIKALTALLPVA
jgi:hypothetical protein